MTISKEIHDILDPGVIALEEKRPDEGDVMNMLGRVVAAVEHLARRLDALTAEQPIGAVPDPNDAAVRGDREDAG